MSKVRLDAARDLILSGHYAPARAVLRTMLDNETAQHWLGRLDEVAPEHNGEGLAVQNWEYKEVFLKTLERRPLDVEYELMDNAMTTVEDFFTRTLDQYGADGWELISERQYGDLTRLLFKRPKEPAQ